jgi:hypothetical protein
MFCYLVYCIFFRGKAKNGRLLSFCVKFVWWFWSFNHLGKNTISFVVRNGIYKKQKAPADASAFCR